MTADPMSPRVDIIIPTYNRAHLIETAVRAALEQSWWHKRITVVDDASTDDTWRALRPYLNRDDFNYIRLSRNHGTAQAKNAGLLLTDGEAVTFHDSDDIPHRDKVLRQVRVLTAQDIHADPCLNWRIAGHTPSSRLDVGVVLSHHELLLPDGRRVEIRRDLSLLDDVFPNLQMGSQVPGEWTHINSGLFRHEMLSRVGGFANCIEEDRELRNRLILNGEVVWVIPEILLTKIETPGSLTQAVGSNYESSARRFDRDTVWRKVDDWRAHGTVEAETIDLPNLAIDFVSNPDMLACRDIPATASTGRAVSAIIRTPYTRFGEVEAIA
ncbi:hypothetical protein P775_16540 [Puniceibacterium antarcticum]|uniref:Glycosyltransferase 2-like domain-containing protein n=1 Tax=Puniceibacterium antarcticum TaxID=1206336 RepID=A0A2G8RBZ0_9RHOB|nr:glycosyltransferase family 2 protein [Puniceibacterium antarcticum]PIL19050.1 hypothetical protein P775_16540 [Puniceibacterium antarcticum]